MTAGAEVVITRGDELPTLQAPELTRTVLALFAGASNDYNPIHIDIDAARSAGQADVFAQGMLSLAFVGRCLTQWVPQQQIRYLQARFVSITPVNVAPTVTGVVTSIDNDCATVNLTVALPDGTVTITAVAEIVLPEN